MTGITEWIWHEGEKDPYFVASAFHVKSKAKFGSLLIQGLPYERAALDAEALQRIQGWGYPGSYAPVDAAVQDVNPAWWISTYPDQPAVWSLFGNRTPEAWLATAVELEGAPVVLAVLPDAPAASEISVAPISSYP